MRAGASSPPFEIRQPSAPPKGASTSGLAGQDLFWIALAGSIAGFVLLVFRPNRDRTREVVAECRLVRSEIAALEARVARLRRWERSLASGDRDAWASVARERLGWVERGEEIIRPPRPLGQTGPSNESDLRPVPAAGTNARRDRAPGGRDPRASPGAGRARDRLTVRGPARTRDRLARRSQ
jgi:cell division protein FtsB